MEDILKVYLRTKDLSVLRRTCTYFEKYWQKIFGTNQLAICVPEDVPNLDGAMEVARLFSLRRVYSRENTVKIMLGEGEHEVDGNDHQQLVVTCNNVTFPGRGASRTTVRGGFNVTHVTPTE